MKKIGVSTSNNGKLSLAVNQLSFIDSMIETSKIYYSTKLNGIFIDVVPDIKIQSLEVEFSILLSDFYNITLVEELSAFELSLQTLCRLSGIKLNFKYEIITP